MQGDRQQSLKAGFDAFVAKPIHRVDLLSVIADCMKNPAQGGPVEAARVLCVEDDEATSLAQSQLLRHHGFVVECATNPQEALGITENFTPDIVFLDLGLGASTGEELLSQFKTKAELANTTFVCLTGRDEKDVTWRELGFDHFFRKPVTIEDLVDFIQREQQRA